VSENYGKWIFPKDGEWNTFFDKENFEKRNKKLVTTITSEQFDISTEIKTFKNFSINNTKVKNYEKNYYFSFH